MASRFLIILFFLAGMHPGFSQNKRRDSLKNELFSVKNDTARFVLLESLTYDYIWSYPDSSVKYIAEMITMAREKNSDEFLAKAYGAGGWFYVLTGDYPRALHAFQESLKIAERWGDIPMQANAYALMEYVYEDWGDYEKAQSSVQTAYHLLMRHWRLTPATTNSDTLEAYQGILLRMGSCYEKLDKLDSALYLMNHLDGLFFEYSGQHFAPAHFGLGNIYAKKKDYRTAAQYYHSGIKLAESIEYNKDLIDLYNGLANIFMVQANYDSSIYYAKRALESGNSAVHIIGQLSALKLVAEGYKANNNVDSIAKYLQLILATQDSLFSQNKIRQIQSLTLNEQIRLREQDQREQQIKDKIRFYALLAGLAVFLVIAFILYRNNRNKQKAFTLLQKQKEETDFQKTKAEKTLEELQATQAQLIHSAKMASLGELTAGIAHEIQNPMNFVNNFAEINSELIDELEAQTEKGDFGEVKNIVSQIKNNENLIAQHGKRADSIVKGMLQHSRTSSGHKELTDINALANEYLRLSYHGIRAKNKSFNATMQTDFDQSIGEVKVVPQDMGRVLLNLFNNAFYAVNEQQKKGVSDYQPVVSVTTKRIGDKIEISVKDNGTGITADIRDKIFQPFFTTKPSGQGTGLGLSLSYDIVKAHGGEISVNSKEGEGAKFIISLPV